MSSDSKTEWFRAFTVSGYPAGFGAHCPVCGGTVRHSLEPGQTFGHCGKREECPSDPFHRLPEKSLGRGMPAHFRNAVFIGDQGEDSLIGPSWDEESNAKSDDPSAFEVKWT